jgi:hypothetical protein
MATDTQDHMFGSILSYAENTLKSIILINGGASVALLAFIGNIIANDENVSLVSKFSLPLAFYVFGVLVGSIATGSSYVTQYKYLHVGQESGARWHIVTAILVLLAYVLFAAGSLDCYRIFRSFA